jgi:hypothetical protein
VNWRQLAWKNRRSPLRCRMPITTSLLDVAPWTATRAAILTADVGFVHFDGTVKHGLFYFFHGSTDAMTEIPSRLVGAFVFPQIVRLSWLALIPFFASQSSKTAINQSGKAKWESLKIVPVVTEN